MGTTRLRLSRTWIKNCLYIAVVSCSLDTPWLGGVIPHQQAPHRHHPDLHQPPRLTITNPGSTREAGEHVTRRAGELESWGARKLGSRQMHQPMQHPCTTHARPGLPVNQNPSLTPPSQGVSRLHDTAAISKQFLFENERKSLGIERHNVFCKIKLIKNEKSVSFLPWNVFVCPKPIYFWQR